MIFSSLVLQLLLMNLGSTRTNPSSTSPHTPTSPWTYVCNGASLTWTSGVCTRMRSEEERPAVSLQRCALSCLPSSVLWPEPVFVEQQASVSEFDLANVEVVTAGGDDQVDQLLNEAVQRQVRFLEKKQGNQKSSAESSTKLQILFAIGSNSLDFNIETDESYSFTIAKIDGNVIRVEIFGATYFGCRHAVETVFQLADWDPMTRTHIIADEVRVEDRPAFPHRGVMLDTARHFISVNKIKELIDAMSFSKLNLLHWHVTDVQSFPLVLESHPEMADFGAYSPDQVYTSQIVSELLDYGIARGVRILPEVDGPSHVGAGWQPHDPSFVLCLEATPWYSYCRSPPCGQLNPTSEGMYEVLTEIHRDVMDMFRTNQIHLGGEEYHFGCWNSSKEVVDWLAERGRGREEEDFLFLWSHFQNTSNENLDIASQQLGFSDSPGITLWSSQVTWPEYIDYLDPKRYTIQIWTDSSDLSEPSIKAVAEGGFKMVFSNSDGLYLDCGFSGWVWDSPSWCSPYKGWQTIYQNDPYTILGLHGVANLDEAVKNVLGAEVAMWTEQTDDQSLMAKVGELVKNTDDLPRRWSPGPRRLASDCGGEVRPALGGTRNRGWSGTGDLFQLPEHAQSTSSP